MAGYRPQAPFLDELFEPDGTPRPTAEALIGELARLGPEGLVEAGRRRDAIFMQQGITFETSRRRAAPTNAPSRSTSCPGSSAARNGATIKRGLAQRIRALNHFVDDVYHAREIVRAGLVPWRLVASCSHFARAVHGIRPPGGVYTHVAGCDLVRHSDGTWKVIEDNVRTPSGISYVLENRVAMARLLPSCSPPTACGRSTTTRRCCCARCARSRPSAESEATVVVWTPGPANRAYFEHAFLARQMGVELVEASDLVVRDDVSTCARRAASRASTRSTAASTTTSSTRSSSAPTRCSACPAWCAPTAPAPWRSPTRSAPASPTTRRSTASCPR